MANTVTARIESDDPDQNGRLVEVDLDGGGAITVTDGTTTVEGVQNVTLEGAAIQDDGAGAATLAWTYANGIESNALAPGSGVDVPITAMDSGDGYATIGAQARVIGDGTATLNNHATVN